MDEMQLDIDRELKRESQAQKDFRVHILLWDAIAQKYHKIKKYSKLDKISANALRCTCANSRTWLWSYLRGDPFARS
jgi:hypothetical protein